MAKQKAAEPVMVSPPLADPVVPYPHELPRWLHRAGDTRRVDTAEDCGAAFVEGWTLRPITQTT